MRVIIDMQGAQTKTCSHNIGQYTLSLAKAIVQSRRDNEIILALNGRFPDTIEHIRTSFDGLLPQQNIRTWVSPGPVCQRDPGNDWRRYVAELVREAFLANFQPDMVIVPSFFEGYLDDAVTSIGLFAPALTTVVAVDSLMPPRTDVTNPIAKTFVLRKLEQLKRSALILALPPLTQDEVCERLKVSPQRVVPVSTLNETGADKRGSLIEASSIFKLVGTPTTNVPHSLRLSLTRRPKLAYVSPLPSEHSGIADYSAELLPELSGYYDIDVIVNQGEITSPWILANCGVQSTSSFLRNAHRYNRVLYQFGNSNYHHHMFDLLSHVPGVVVLHDFYLGDLQWYREAHAHTPYAWTKALFASHGYSAVVDRYHATDDAYVVRKYPANFEVIQQAEGIIVHSDHARDLSNCWYGRQLAANWAAIPHLRAPSNEKDRDAVRRKLGLKSNSFLVCSFGLLGPTKLNHRLLNAWLQSSLAKDTCCFLVFVGNTPSGQYGTRLLARIHKSGLKKRIQITGWANAELFQDYLSIADIAVQLRTHSRGETSGTVLDCMNHGLPTIVNASGSLAELPRDAVWMLPDEFTDALLIEALESLWHEPGRRHSLGERARRVIRDDHDPSQCARLYRDAIEHFYYLSETGTSALISAIAANTSLSFEDGELYKLAKDISTTLPFRRPSQRLFLDISATCRHDLKTGIERVARALLLALLEASPAGCRIEPVYLSNTGGKWHYRGARYYTLGLLRCPPDVLEDEVLEPEAGDVVLGLDISGDMLVQAEGTGLFTEYRNRGVAIYFIVHDLLPIRMPEVFPPGADVGHLKWLRTISKFDGAICVSKAVADDLGAWQAENGFNWADRRTFRIACSHHGADFGNSAASQGLPDNAELMLGQLKGGSTFLMVGTIEPRKGYLQVIEAFSQLWIEGVDVNLVIVGQEGWKDLPDKMRRDIPETVQRIRGHAELNRRLLWLEGISDEYLEAIYTVSTCLIAASKGEGFGLPLIEAAQHKLPIIARDIPVFREVAGMHAFYFSGFEPDDMACAIKNWISLKTQHQTPSSLEMPWITWKESASLLMKTVFNAKSDT
jgi:glycosyltransferase involved in cell wall biosynthesis